MFLIDHAWIYEVNYAREQLKIIPGLADRLALLMGPTNTGNAVYIVYGTESAAYGVIFTSCLCENPNKRGTSE